MAWDAITQCIDIYEMCTGNSDLISDVLSSEPKTNNVYDFTLDGQKKKFMNLKDEIVGYWLEYSYEITKGLTSTGTSGILLGEFGKAVTGKDSLTIGDITSGYLHTLLKSRDAIMDEYPIFNVRGRTEEYYNDMKGYLQSGYNSTINAGAESNIPYLSDYCKGLEGDTISDWNIIKLRGSFARGELDAIGSMVYGTIEMFIDPLETQSEIADLLAMDGEDLAKIKDQALEYLDKKVKNGTAEERSEFAGSAFANIAMLLLMPKAAKKPKTPTLLAEESGVEIKVAEEAALKGGSKTGNVWDNINATQLPEGGNSIPKSFTLTTKAGDYWVNPNATKHMLEYANRGFSHGLKMTEQELLTSFEAAVNEAAEAGYIYNKPITINHWELIFSPAREAGQLPVIKHALYIP